METQNQNYGSPLWFLGFIVAFLAVMLLVDSGKDSSHQDDDLMVADVSVLNVEGPVYSTQSVEVQQPITTSTLKDLARSRLARCKQTDEYCSEFTVIETYERAALEDPDFFDEASEAFTYFIRPDMRTAVYLRVMHAYANLIGVHHAALDNYLMTFDHWLKLVHGSVPKDRVETWDIDYVFTIFRKAWETSQGDERLLHKVVEFQQYYEYAVVHDEGFDPERRYTEAYLEQLGTAGQQDPFRCSPLPEYIADLLWIAEIQGDDVKVRKWKVHLADYYANVHICEDGYPRPEPEKAFKLFTDLGMRGEAKRAAWIVVCNDANTFVFGGDTYAPWRDEPKPCDPSVLAHMMLWYPRTGLDAAQQNADLLDFAKAIEEVGYLDAALKIYEAIGAKDEADWLRPLAQGNPRPSNDVQLDHFLMRLEMSEP